MSAAVRRVAASRWMDKSRHCRASLSRICSSSRTVNLAGNLCQGTEDLGHVLSRVDFGSTVAEVERADQLGFVE